MIFRGNSYDENFPIYSKESVYMKLLHEKELFDWNKSDVSYEL